MVGGEENKLTYEVEQSFCCLELAVLVVPLQGMLATRKLWEDKSFPEVQQPDRGKKAVHCTPTVSLQSITTSWLFIWL